MSEKKIAVVGLAGKWSTEVLAEAVEAATGFRLIVDIGKAHWDLNSGNLWYGGYNLCELDGIIVKKISAEYSPNTLDRLELLRVAENAGVRVFSPAMNMLRLIDRLSCTVTLANQGIPMPDTRATEDVDAAFETVQDFGEAIFKPLYSTKARGMCLFSSQTPEAELKKQIAAYQMEHPLMYIQKRLDLQGKDFGMVFLGGEYLGTYARIKQNESWNTTINSGGRYEKFDPPQNVVDLAMRAQAPFAMDFTTVDVAETPEGPIIFEVSAFGGFRGAKEGIGIDAAKLYVDYALKELELISKIPK